MTEEAAPQLSHTDPDGAARMVDVTDKRATRRTAVASGSIRMTARTLDAIMSNALAKGDVLNVARIAGIMAAKRTSDLIPLCHPVALTHVDVEFTPDQDIPGLRCEATAVTLSQTGVEMEAILAVAVALTTIYDMAKSADRAMVMGDIRLEYKSGGRSGEYRRETAPANDR